MNKLAIGVEIGGTKLQAGIGMNGDRLCGLARADIDPAKGADGIRRSIPSLIDETLSQAGCTMEEIGGIGVGFGGPVDSQRGVVLASHQIEGWSGFELQSWFETQFQKPCRIQNDASIAGYAEAHLGAGKGRDRVFYITIGSGIGGGWIVNGQIDEGQGLGIAEIGHTWIPDPDTGEPEKLELVCSGWSIGRRAQEALRDGESSILQEWCKNDIDSITAKDVYRAVEDDDMLAESILDETCQGLAVAICNVIALLHPQTIIIGGGVSLMGSIFWDILRDAVNQNAFEPFQGTYEIVPAKLGENVVVVGAVLLGQSIQTT